MRLATLVVVAAVGVGGAASARAPAEVDLLLIESNRSGMGQLYLVSTEGGAMRRLGHPRDESGLLSVSPDGRRIVYADYRREGVYMVGSDGRGLRRLASIHDWEFDGPGAWNSAGTLFAFPREPAFGIYDRSGRRRRLVLDADGGSAAWSPDGKSIAFTTAESRFRIDQVRADGSDRRRLAGGDSADTFASAWSPDGNRMAYVRSSARSGEQIFITSRGLQTRLTRGPAAALSPAWSPDGRWIAYVQVDDEDGEIWVVAEDGTRARRLTQGWDDRAPAWSPDGRTILFDRSEGEDEPSRLHSVRAGGGKPVLRARGFVSDPAWLPAGDAFVATVRRGRAGAIGLFTAAGSLRRLLTRFGEDSAPAVSPDGRRISFVRGGRIAVMPSEGGKVTLVTGSDERHDEPAWGPDGISFDVGPSTGVVTLDLDNSRRRTIARDAETLFGTVSWSPRGDIAYTMERGVRIRTSTGSVLGTYRTDDAFGAEWSPRGDYVAVGLIDDTVAFLRRDGRVSRRLRAESWTWHPDGRRVVLDRENRVSIVLDLATGRTRPAQLARGEEPGALFTRDARRFAFDRARISGLQHDVYLGATRRQVTRPFPDGGDNRVVGWARGPRPPNRTAPSVGTLRPTPVVRARYVHALWEAGSGVAFLAGASSSALDDFGYRPCRPLHYLEGTRVARTYRPCRGAAPLVAATANSLGATWVLYDDDDGLGDEEGSCVYTQSASASPPQPRLPCGSDRLATGEVVLTLGWVVAGVQSAGDLTLAGWPEFEDGEVWNKLVKVTDGRLTTIVRTRAELELLDVDRSRVAALLGGRVVVVYSAAGVVLRMLPFAKNTVLDVDLDGGRLVVLRSNAIEQYELRSGIRRVQLPIRRGFAGLPTLHGAAGGRAAYVVGAVLHLVRFADRSDRAYWLNGLVPPIHAALTERGLYVGVNRMLGPKHGTVGFVPTAELDR